MAELEEVSRQDLKSLKIFWNGLKYNGGPLDKMDFYKSDGKIDARRSGYYGYSYSFPNFLDNAMPMEPENPLYPFFLEGFYKSRIHSLKGQIKWDERYTAKCKSAYERGEITKERFDKIIKTYASEKAEKEEEVKALSAKLTNKNPTAKDIAAYNAYMDKQEEEERKAEEARQMAESAKRQAVYDHKLKEAVVVEALAKKYPVKDTDPYYVVVYWSEHAGIGEAIDRAGGKPLVLSFRAADEIIGCFDKENHLNRDSSPYWGGYDKTMVSVRDMKTDKEVYSDRYDIGDGYKGLGHYGIVGWVYSIADYLIRHDGGGKRAEELMALAKDMVKCYKDSPATLNLA